MTDPTKRLEARADADRMAERVRLWDAINAYVVSCGGDPDRQVYGNTRRQTAVAQVEQIVREIRVSVRNEEREACAAYCLDRADQYDTSSGTWVGLADAAEGIAKGEASGMLERGETEDLLARVRKLAGFTRPTRKARDR
jgi:hypothetical protein